MARHFRKVLRITAEHSPNVLLGLMQQAAGETPTGEVVIPGVLTWDDYQKRLATWDVVRICIGLKAMFWKGPQALLFPPGWLDLAEDRHRHLGRRGVRRRAKGIGIDPAEGGDRTSLAAVDELGLIELISLLTPDTAVVRHETIAFGRRHNVDPENWVFDRGGGGQQHADTLREQGYKGVRTVAFGESLTPMPKPARLRPYPERLEQREDRGEYVNRRAEMYGELAKLFDPARLTDGETAFALPGYDGSNDEAYRRLREQLAVLPRLLDGEGRLYLPPKRKKAGSQGQSLTELIGHSPDEADAVVLALYSLRVRPTRARAGVF